METDFLFYQLLKQLPETLFALVGKPLDQAAYYRFDAVELKKSYRLDGLFIPNRPGLPLYFVEVQFRRKAPFYANLFAKVFSYLEANDPEQDWIAVILFPSRAAEPKELAPYEPLLGSRHVRRVYMNELTASRKAPPGLTILQLATAAENQTKALASLLLHRAAQEPDCERADIIIGLTEEVLIRRYHELGREEIRRMFKLHDIRKTRVWEEAHQAGMEKGIEKGVEKGMQKGREEGTILEKRRLVGRLLASGQTLEQIADLLGIPISEVRRLRRR